MPNHRDNLYEPVDGLHRTAGRVTERALDSAPLSSERAGQLLTAAAVAVAIMLVALG